MLTLLLSVGFLALVAIAGLGLVRALCDRQALPDGVALAVAAPLGLYAVSLLAFALAMWGPPVGRGWAVALLLVGATAGAAVLTRRRGWGVRWAPQGALRGDLALAACLVAVAVALAAPALHRLFSSDLGWDAAHFHLPIARSLFESGRLPAGISPSRQEAPFAAPPLTFVGYGLYWLFLGKVHHLAPALGGWLVTLATAALLAAMVRDHLGGSRLAAAAATLLLVSDPVQWQAELHGGPDAALAFLVLAGIDAALRRRAAEDPARRRGLLALSAVLAGLAAGTRTGGLAWVAMLAALHVHLGGARQGAAFAGMALAVSAPAYLRNLLELGNPVYPHLAGVFGGRHIDGWSLANVLPSFHGRLPSGFRSAMLAEVLAWAPAMLAIVGLRVRAEGQAADRRADVAGLLVVLAFGSALVVLPFVRGPATGPAALKLLLPALPLLCAVAGAALARILEGRERPAHLVALAAGSGILAAWIEGSPFAPPNLVFGTLNSGRWLAVEHPLASRAFLLLALAVLAALRPPPSLPEPGVVRLGRRLVLPLLVLTLIYPALGPVEGYVRAVVVGRRLFPDHTQVPWLPATRTLHAEAAARVLMLDSRRYLMPAGTIPFDAPAMWPLLRRSGVPYDEVADHLRDIGVTHVYLDGKGEDHPLWLRGPLSFMVNDPRHFTVVERTLDFRLYRLTPSRPPPEDWGRREERWGRRGEP